MSRSQRAGAQPSLAASTIVWNGVVPALGVALILGASVLVAFAVAAVAALAVHAVLAPEALRGPVAAHTGRRRAPHRS